MTEKAKMLNISAPRKGSCLTLDNSIEEDVAHRIGQRPGTLRAGKERRGAPEP